ncbi:hypothetical protein Tco_0016447 [Tanacetum coccineum]
MYQIWHTLQVDRSRYQFRFSLSTKELIMNVADFRRIFQLPQATDNNHVGFVDAPTFGQMAQFFHYNLGFKMPLRYPSNFVSKGHPQPSYKCSIVSSIICMWTMLKLSGKIKDGAGLKIPDWMLTDAMKLTDHYKMYAAIFWVDVPTTQSQPTQSTQGIHRTPSARRSPNLVTTEATEIDVTNLHETIQMSIATQINHKYFEAKQNVEMVQEHLEDEELDHFLVGNENVIMDEFMNDIFNSQEDPDTKIEPRIDKESPEAEIDADMGSVNTNEEEKESAGDESTRTHIAPLSKDKVTLQELTIITKDAPLSVDKEKHKELTISDSTPSSSTPSSSSSLKPNTGRSDDMLYQAIKEMLPSMVNKEVNKIAKMTVPIYVVEGLLLERQKNEDEVAAMIAEAIQKERQTLEVISQINDVVANHIPLQFEGITAATACRPSAIRPRDHDDYQDDNARPEGENSVKRL